MKKVIKFIFVPILFLAGLSLLLYPFISNQWNNYRQSQLINSYDETVAEMESSGAIDYDAEWERAQDFNESLVPYILPDSFAIAEATEENQEYLSCLNLTGDEMMGYVEIPKINVKIPIYHTTTEEVLQTAAGHLEGSSLPVGGESTHAVISAHRGLPSAALFTDLDRLEEGDYFLLYILNEVLCYQVDQTTTVEPTETEALSVVEGEDLVTLLTCTPYGVNSHRLLVRGHRVPYEPKEVEQSVPGGGLIAAPSIRTNYLLWVMIGLGTTFVFILILYFLDRKRRRKLAVRPKEAAVGDFEVVDLEEEDGGQ
ncbi:MAG: class C sortase [Roseburia sp.]|nr:class C sortase [Roseburia sp.]MCM1097917.1 class C sortase [Ruminococcus flavefaciens]